MAHLHKLNREKYHFIQHYSKGKSSNRKSHGGYYEKRDESIYINSKVIFNVGAFSSIPNVYISL